MQSNTYHWREAAKQNRKKGVWRRANTIPYARVETLIDTVRRKSNAPQSDELKLALSFFAGLRVGEIAQLTVDDFTDATGATADSIIVRGSISKNGQSRTVPMHPRVREAFERLRRAHPEVTRIAFSCRHGRTRPQSVAAVTKWFSRVYAASGLRGCSSHSGRRTFITNLAQSMGNFNTSLADIQRIVGHAQLDTTQRYIEPTKALHAFVSTLGVASASAEGVSRKAPCRRRGGRK